MRKNYQILLLSAVVFVCGIIQHVDAIIGNEVGNEAPNFSLPNTETQIVSLNTHRQQKNVILIFYRGQW